MDTPIDNIMYMLSNYVQHFALWIFGVYKRLILTLLNEEVGHCKCSIYMWGTVGKK